MTPHRGTSMPHVIVKMIAGRPAELKQGHRDRLYTKPGYDPLK